MSKSWLASDRFALAMAPGGMALVQDFLNTAAIGGTSDLLADPETAHQWVNDAVQAWSVTRGEDLHPPALNAVDLTTLQILRSQLGSLLSGEAEGSGDLGVDVGVGIVSTSFGLSETGAVRLEPAGDGWQWLASALWGEALLSQATDTWRRLKQCRNPDCRSAFYDRSKNNSGVWHNVKACGNAANLRASRARRRQNRPTGDEE